MNTVPATPVPGHALQWWTEYWRGLYATPRAWAHKGELLFHAFEAIADASVPGSMHLNMRDQALMLAGMSVEVQLKAIIVHSQAARAVVTASRPAKTSQDRALWDAFYSHSLTILAQHAGVALTPAQAATAAALTEFIYWRGRYVLPTERGIGSLIPVVLPTGLVGDPLQQDSFDTVRELIAHVIKAVKASLYGVV